MSSPGIVHSQPIIEEVCRISADKMVFIKHIYEWKYESNWPALILKPISLLLLELPRAELHHALCYDLNAISYVRRAQIYAKLPTYSHIHV